MRGLVMYLAADAQRRHHGRPRHERPRRPRSPERGAGGARLRARAVVAGCAALLGAVALLVALPTPPGV